MFLFLFSCKKNEEARKTEKKEAVRSHVDSRRYSLTTFIRINSMFISELHVLINQFIYICLTEMIDSSTFKRLSSAFDNILENLEDVDLAATGQVQYKYWTFAEMYNVITSSLCPPTDDDEIPEELLLGKHQLHDLCSASAKIKSMGIFNKVKQMLPC